LPISSLVIPSSFSVPNSTTGKPCVSQPALLESLFEFYIYKKISLMLSHNMVNSGNPFAEVALQKHERLVAFTSGYSSQIYFLSSKISTSDATVGKSSPLYSVNFALILSFSLIEVRK
jgi:hypothetical protein